MSKITNDGLTRSGTLAFCILCELFEPVAHSEIKLKQNTETA